MTFSPDTFPIPGTYLVPTARCQPIMPEGFVTVTVPTLVPSVLPPEILPRSLVEWLRTAPEPRRSP